jgi:hypothetical protein
LRDIARHIKAAAIPTTTIALSIHKEKVESMPVRTEPARIVANGNQPQCKPPN